MSHHPVLVEHALASLTDELKALLPDLGNIVAVDSTTVRTHGNPNRKVLSDPEASWTAKNSPRARRMKKRKSNDDRGKTKRAKELEDGKEWFYGYKLHAVADATYGIPLGGIVTTAKRNDSPLLPEVINHAQQLHPWLKPKAVIADRGYDSEPNHRYLYRKTIASIIHIRKNAKAVNDETHSLDGRPFCFGNQPMEHVTTNPKLGHLYRCPPEGCALKGSMKTGIRHCDHQHWEHPSKDLRFFSWIPRHSDTWKNLYTKRQAIERFFKGAKESRRLEKHCVRGLGGIRLHALMSIIGFQATALVKVRAGQLDDMRWLVRKVA